MTTDAVSIGTIEVHLLRDGSDRVPAEMILGGASPEEMTATIAGHADADGQLAVAHNGVLVRSAGRVVLIDAGFGELSESEGAGGELLHALARLGMEPREIDDVVVTHAHADHIGGLTRGDGSGRQVPVFEAARHWFWRDEWMYWTAEAVLAAMPAYLADPARLRLPSISAAGLVNLVDAEQEVAEGVRIVSAPGHTPGHVVVAIESEGVRAMYLGDAIFHELNVVRPEWTCVFDVDPGAAVRTRRSLLDSASRDQILVLAAHLPRPGRVASRGTSYAFVEE